MQQGALAFMFNAKSLFEIIIAFANLGDLTKYILMIFNSFH